MQSEKKPAIFVTLVIGVGLAQANNDLSNSDWDDKKSFDCLSSCSKMPGSDDPEK